MVPQDVRQDRETGGAIRHVSQVAQEQRDVCRAVESGARSRAPGEQSQGIRDELPQSPARCEDSTLAADVAEGGLASYTAHLKDSQCVLAIHSDLGEQ